MSVVKKTVDCWASSFATSICVFYFCTAYNLLNICFVPDCQNIINRGKLDRFSVFYASDSFIFHETISSSKCHFTSFLARNASHEHFTNQVADCSPKKNFFRYGKNLLLQKTEIIFSFSAITLAFWFWCFQKICTEFRKILGRRGCSCGCKCKDFSYFKRETPCVWKIIFN